MNCCKNENNKEENNLVTGHENATNNYTDTQAPKNNHKKHLLHMALCCGLPLLILLALPLIGYKGILLNIAPFICPIMMLVMMTMMMRGNGRSCHHSEPKSTEEKQQQ